MLGTRDLFPLPVESSLVPVRNRKDGHSHTWESGRGDEAAKVDMPRVEALVAIVRISLFSLLLLPLLPTFSLSLSISFTYMVLPWSPASSLIYKPPIFIYPLLDLLAYAPALSVFLMIQGDKVPK